MLAHTLITNHCVILKGRDSSRLWVHSIHFRTNRPRTNSRNLRSRRPPSQAGKRSHSIERALKSLIRSKRKIDYVCSEPSHNSGPQPKAEPNLMNQDRQARKTLRKEDSSSINEAGNGRRSTVEKRINETQNNPQQAAVAEPRLRYFTPLLM